MILVTGANGQLGSELRLLLSNDEAFFADHQTGDITNYSLIEKIIVNNNITAIINCAAYTAVDKAELDKESAFKINETGPLTLAELSSKHKLKLIHISTDYVFDGRQNVIPLKEEHETNPRTIYGSSKLAGEKVLLRAHPEAVVIRTSWLYSSFGNNFVKTITRYAKERENMNIVFDQVGTPTYAADLAAAIVHILPQMNISNSGIYHYSNEGAISWYDFAQTIVELKQLPCRISPIESHEYPTPTPRPNYSVLNKKKIKETFKLTIPYWKDSLIKCLKKIS